MVLIKFLTVLASFRLGRLVDPGAYAYVCIDATMLFRGRESWPMARRRRSLPESLRLFRLGHSLRCSLFGLRCRVTAGEGVTQTGSA